MIDLVKDPKPDQGAKETIWFPISAQVNFNEQNISEQQNGTYNNTKRKPSTDSDELQIRRVK